MMIKFSSKTTEGICGWGLLFIQVLSFLSVPSDLFTAATIPNMATGELYLTRPVNYEDIQSYDITVRVQNNADGAPGACPSQTSGGKYMA